MAPEVQTEAYLSYDEIETWEAVPPGTCFTADDGNLVQDLLDPRLIRWLRAKGFDLNERISTKQCPDKGAICYSQPRIVDRKIMVPGGFVH